MNIPWLKTLEDGWRKVVAHGRAPHAILLSGATGVGKRSLAAWLARERLALSGAELGSDYPLVIPQHADLRWISPLEDKQTIGVDQVRALVADLSLTSYAGGAKVAVIEPAPGSNARGRESENYSHGARFRLLDGPADARSLPTAR